MDHTIFSARKLETPSKYFILWFEQKLGYVLIMHIRRLCTWKPNNMEDVQKIHTECRASFGGLRRRRGAASELLRRRRSAASVLLISLSSAINVLKCVLLMCIQHPGSTNVHNWHMLQFLPRNKVFRAISQFHCAENCAIRQLRH